MAGDEHPPEEPFREDDSEEEELFESERNMERIRAISYRGSSIIEETLGVDIAVGPVGGEPHVVSIDDVGHGVWKNPLTLPQVYAIIRCKSITS